VKGSPDEHDPNLRNRADDQPAHEGDEYDIDQILAESFPASDAPPWTLGVEHHRVEDSEAARKRRRNRS
jgi:hypothetical protein